MILLKPETFMNLSGQSVGEAARFYKLAPEDVVVFHDELDLAPGKLRVKQGGGHAGHNGLRSIEAHLGREYARVRLGIGHPGHKDRVAGYVLQDFAKADADWLDDLMRGDRERRTLAGRGQARPLPDRRCAAHGPGPPRRETARARPRARDAGDAPRGQPQPLAEAGGPVSLSFRDRLKETGTTLLPQHPSAIRPERVEGEGEHHVMGHVAPLRVAHPHGAHVAALGDGAVIHRRGLAAFP